MPKKAKSKPKKRSPKIKHNPIIWVEIPVVDMDRAKNFYTKSFGLSFEMIGMYEYKLALFSMDKNVVGTGGALVMGPTYQPSYHGPVVYFASKDIGATLNKVSQHGGKVIQNKKSIGQYGFVAYFEDTEGNRIALHSMN